MHKFLKLCVSICKDFWQDHKSILLHVLVGTCAIALLHSATLPLWAFVTLTFVLLLGTGVRSRVIGRTQTLDTIDQRIRDTEHLQERIFMNSTLNAAMNKYRVRGVNGPNIQ